MANSQKSLTLAILKVHNWNEDNSDQYQFCFCSSLSHSLILEKRIKTHSHNNQLAINTSLRITYTAEEKQIIIKMGRVERDNTITPVQEFMVDLEQLEEKKIQFLPFSKNDKILEVQSGTAHRQKREERKEKKTVVSNNHLDDFILEKEVYLRNISAQSRSRYGDVSSRDSFAEKLYALLQETKHLRLKIQSQRNGEKERDYPEIQYKVSPVNQVQTNKQSLLIKSYSENTLNPHQDNKKVHSNIQTSNRNIMSTRRCKLDLRNLTVITLPDTIPHYIDPLQSLDEVLQSHQSFPLQS